MKATNNSHGSEPSIFCFTSNAIGEVILRLSAAHHVAADFRGKVLATTQLGKRLVKYYDTHQSELFHVVRNDRKLVADCVDAWVAVVPFVKNMVDATSKTGSKETKQTIRFSKQNHVRWVALINRFRSGSKDRAFRKVLDELEPELGRYVGLSAPEAVETLRSSRQRE